MFVDSNCAAERYEFKRENDRRLSRERDERQRIGASSQFPKLVPQAQLLTPADSLKLHVYDL